MEFFVGPALDIFCWFYITRVFGLKSLANIRFNSTTLHVYSQLLIRFRRPPSTWIFCEACVGHKNIPFVIKNTDSILGCVFYISKSTERNFRAREKLIKVEFARQQT